MTMSPLKQIAAAVLATVVLALQAHAQDAVDGQKLFQQRCGACHQIDSTRNGVGPHLQGVIGRTSGVWKASAIRLPCKGQASPGMRSSSIPSLPIRLAW